MAQLLTFRQSTADILHYFLVFLTSTHFDFSMSKIPSLFVPCSFELRLVQNQSSQRTVVEGLPIFTFCRSYNDNSVKLLKTVHKSLCIALTWSVVGETFDLLRTVLITKAPTNLLNRIKNGCIPVCKNTRTNPL